MLTAIAAIGATCGLAAVTGWLLNRRSGTVRASRPDAEPREVDFDFSGTGPTIVHFSAPWCGPCSRVRHVVDEVCASLGDPTPVAHVEIDIDANPLAARQFSVLSLPTTLIFDADGRQRYRTTGVPKAADLRSALQPLLA
ncbi:MAG: thioredoxin family protein [Mycobacteriaceae bacterium]|nr:thioredoxin family protein [Mycobacteriaceae bacterium]